MSIRISPQPRNSAARLRVATGVPTGGEFASRDRAEASIGLTEPTPVTARTPLEPHAALRFAEQVIAGKATRYRIYDNSVRDDIAQTALLSVLTSLNNKRVDGLTGGLIANAVNHAMAAAVAERTGVKRPEDIKALKMLDARIEQLTQELGREPTHQERDEIARQIREKWEDPRHRPLKGYQSRVQLEDVDESDDALQVTATDNSETDGDDDDSYDLRQLDAELDAGAISKEDATLRLWCAVARTEGLPPVQRRIDRSIVARNSRAIRRAGGAHIIAEHYLATGIRTKELEGILHLFDIRNDNDVDNIAELLASRGPAAEHLWKSAALAATA